MMEEKFYFCYYVRYNIIYRNIYIYIYVQKEILNMYIVRSITYGGGAFCRVEKSGAINITPLRSIISLYPINVHD